jgi:glycosyltransferase involved in cell wall biosynthesis
MVAGLKEIGDVSVTLMLPRLYGDEDHSGAHLLGLFDSFDHKPNGSVKVGGVYGRDLVDAARAFADAALERIDKIESFDVIHAHDWLTVPAATSIKQTSGKPLLLHVHSTEFDRAGINASADIIAIEVEGMRAADRIIAVSDYTRNYIVEHYGQAPEKVSTIHNGITPNDSISPCLSASRGVVTFLGRVTHQKGPSYFISAAHKALQSLPWLHFVMAGDGDLLESMRTLAKSLGIDNRVSFPGFLRGDEVRHLLDQSIVYVMPSVSEPFGISALEAIDACVPAVLSRQSGVVELFENVVKVDHWDVGAMAEAIVRIATDVDFSEHLRRGARLEMADIRWTKSARQLKACYGSLVDQAASTAFL